MTYRRNKQFLLACDRYYNDCHSPKQYDPCDDTGTCNCEKCCVPCEQPVTEPHQCDVCPQRNTPETIIDVLCTLINEQVDVITPFGVITGTLLEVKSDYIVILEDTGAQVLVRTDKIESVSPIT